MVAFLLFVFGLMVTGAIAVIFVVTAFVIMIAERLPVIGEIITGNRKNDDDCK